ncbi:MAG: M20/M25/M40 family metallo-hydrolase [Caldilineaceae bacterium]|nr:M20/M25/M40 family metallo-hydrolase [Caldilineaceae bacterium]
MMSTIPFWLSRLVQIPSVSPAQAGPRAGVPGEAAIAHQLATWFAKFGAQVHTEEVLPDRPNVYAVLPGTSDRWLAVEVHTDTVGVEQMTGEPFSGEVREDRVYGRGAVDNKATLALVLALLEEMAQTGQRPTANLLIAATVDEEVGTAGAPAAAAWLQRQGLVMDQMIVAEPTLCTPIHGHKGVVRLAFTVQGKASHSSQPHLGENAIVGAAAIVDALQREHERLQQLPTSPLGNPMLTVTLIAGGSGINVVPDACTVSIDRRVVAGEEAKGVAADLQALAESTTPLPVVTNSLTVIDAFYQSPDTPLVRMLSEWSGYAPQVAPYGTNAWAYRNFVKECVVFGPGSIDQAHGAEEWVAVAELEKAAGVYRRWLSVRGDDNRV